MPVAVNLVDAEEKIEAFLTALDGMIAEGLVTLERVRIIAYRRNGGGQ